jgi:hypothetical protein
MEAGARDRLAFSGKLTSLGSIEYPNLRGGGLLFNNLVVNLSGMSETPPGVGEGPAKVVSVSSFRDQL